ncbi:MAG: acetyl-CoA carboxylase biotin carboxylase subunit [Candidatus Marinimicrobia bacterium]|nr:acetyl-CoA carboxylase biotin carboxylase subunit [Candidatus Neomarinimicrobiota bacterium]MBL7022550.1 acetyl-CoA carboxylase biotin carboxylase subunit [Candidatus Neomarinimicrobiota bacterium]MBL7108906.1 acetyl-CoA carboxylase biotin carboxylase subunit [Candidatus Neomarinimicrobiota bacterium]
MIRKILIANRGEIAVRVIRSCHEIGIETVAIYSEADRTSPHVLKATEAYCVGPAPSSESYLNVEKILEIIQISGADAVHPGYGFLSENAKFADTIAKMGVVWIGPPSDAIITMGDKMAARELAKKVNAPIIPGTTEPISSLDKAIKIADKIGYPVLIKAAGGGGGKGMRIVQSAQEIEDAINRAKSEAGKAFSDDRIYIEKYLEEPHHIEIQVFADNHGNVVSFGERECSVQRRYQKIIEETPSPFIDDKLRKQLNETAINITRECNYIGAGTVEFLVDKHKNLYFLEMNTRLQVEHPITEMVNQIDLVKEQIRVADGKQLSISQNEIHPKGHAIECRLYAEDGFNNFAPSVGNILEMDIPQGLGIRLDDGIRTGQEISPYYDPLLGKLISWGNTRKEAMARMIRALSEFHIVGIETTIPFCKMFIQHPRFQNGDYGTKTLEEIKEELLETLREYSDDLNVAASIGAIQKNLLTDQSSASNFTETKQISNWATSGRKDNLR